MKLKFKKGISPVVAISLILVISVVGVGSFQVFLGGYLSESFTKLELKSNDYSLNIEFAQKDTLFIKSNSNQNISFFKITDINGETKCSFSKKSQPISNLVGYWNFDNRNSTHILDNSNNNNHLLIYYYNTPNSSIMTFNEGLNGEAGLFDTGIWAEALESQTLDTTNAITILYWAKYPKGGYAISNRRLIQYGDNGSISGVHTGLSQDLSASSINFISRTGGGAGYNLFSTLEDSQWTFSAFSGNSSRRLLQKNLIFTQGGGTGTYPLLTNTTLRIGRANGISGNLENFLQDTYLDEIRIYNISLTNEEIKNIFYSDMFNFEIGINEVIITNCSLEVGVSYNIFMLGGNSKTEEKIIVK